MRKKLSVILCMALAASSLCVLPAEAAEDGDAHGEAIACIESTPGGVSARSSAELELKTLMTLDGEKSRDSEKNSKSDCPVGAALTQVEPVRELVLVKSDSMSTSELVKELEKRDEVVFAEPNYTHEVCSINSERSYEQLQWAFENNGDFADGESGFDAGNDSDYKGSDEVIIAVVDTGIDYEHENLSDRMIDLSKYPGLMEDTGCGVHGYNSSCDDKPKSDIMDYRGHGTHCAGIIGANGENGGVLGVMSDVTLLGVRVFSQSDTTTSAEVLEGLNWIKKAKADYGVDIKAFNYSLGGGYASLALNLAFNQLDELGITGVFGSGNNGISIDGQIFSSAFESVDSSIVVNAANPDASPAYYTNYGNATDIFAPGTSVFSTVSQHAAEFNSFTSVQNGTAIVYEGFEAEGADDARDPSTVQGLVFHYYDENAENYCGEPVPLTNEHSFLGSSSLDIQADKGETAVIVSEPIDISHIDNFDEAYTSLVCYSNSGYYLNAISIDFCASGEGTGEDGFTQGFFNEINTINNAWRAGSTSNASSLGTIDGLNTESFQIKLTVNMNDNTRICIDSVGVGFGKENYALYMGTSMAAPVVTGAYGVLCSQFPDECNNKLSARIIGGAVRYSQFEGLCETGGMLNIEKSVTNPDPVIQSRAVDADSITLYGWFLGEEKGEVTINGTALEVEAWTPDRGNSIGSIRLKLPKSEGFIGRQLVKITRAGEPSAYGLKYVSLDLTDTSFNELATPVGDLYSDSYSLLLAQTEGEIYSVTFTENNTYGLGAQELYHYDAESDEWESLGIISTEDDGFIIKDITGYNGSLYSVYTSYNEETNYWSNNIFCCDTQSGEISILEDVDVTDSSVLLEYKGRLTAVGGVVGVDEDFNYIPDNKVVAIDAQTGETELIGTIPENYFVGTALCSGDDLVLLQAEPNDYGEYEYTGDIMITDLNGSCKVYKCPDTIRQSSDDFACAATDNGVIVTALPAYLDDGTRVDTWALDKSTGEWSPSQALLSTSVTFRNNCIYVDGTLYAWGFSQVNEKKDFFRSYTFEESEVTPTEPATEPTTEPATEPATEPTTEPATEASTQPSTEPSTEPSTAPPTAPSTSPSTAQPTTTSAEQATEPVTEGAAGALSDGTAKPESATGAQSAAADLGGEAAKTGDSSAYVTSSCLALMSLAAAVLVLCKRRKDR